MSTSPDLDHFDAMDASYRTFFPDHAYPARTTTQSTRMFGGSLVENHLYGQAIAPNMLVNPPTLFDRRSNQRTIPG